MAHRLKRVGSVLWIAIEGYQKHNVTRLAASIAYYGVLSLAPLVVIMVAVAGLFFGQRAVDGLIVGQLQNALGGDAARTVQNLIASAYHSRASLLATILAVVVLVFSASRSGRSPAAPEAASRATSWASWSIWP
jgi:membrane protein